MALKISHTAYSTNQKIFKSKGLQYELIYHRNAKARSIIGKPEYMVILAK